MLARGRELWLAPMITHDWLRDGLAIAVTNAPTRFGPVSFRIDSHIAQGRIEAEVQPPIARPFLQVVLRLRHPAGHPIARVSVNGTPHADFDPEGGIVRLSPNLGRLRVAAGFAASPEGQ